MTMPNLMKFLVPGAIVALVAAFAVSMFTGEEQKHLTAIFPRTISLYEGSDVRVLGVPVGTVDSVTPSGTGVKVEMSYDADLQIPADAEAVIISPSIVGDRFVQLTPVYRTGPELKDGATLDLSKTSTPLELDEVFGSIDQLTVALGPEGANKNGALSDLLDSAAENWGGQGEQFHQTIGDIGKLTGTLDDNKEELFGTAKQLEAFISTLAKNDKTVSRFNQSLSQVSTMLAGERTELATSLRNLATAMGQVSGFVKENKAILGRNIKGLNRVAKGNIVDQMQTDPALVLCTMINQADQSGQICDVIKDALPRPAAYADGAPVQPATPSYDPTLGGLVEVGS